MVRLGKSKLSIKYDVPSFSHYINIEVEPPNSGELLYRKAMPTFSYGCDSMTGVGKLKQCTKFEVAIASSIV